MPAIFVDSILVDNEFNIVIVSQNILDFLEFSATELAKKNLNYVTAQIDLISELKEEISRGYIDERVTTLSSKTNQPFKVVVSGFSLGLISEIRGYVILKVKRLDEVTEIEEKLQKKSAELDKFIYRTAHDLRGPLATMKGLINLIKIREDNLELDRFILLLDAHANRLDERLFQLVYVAQSGHAKGVATHSVDFDGIETNLRQIIEKNAFVDFLEFHYAAPGQKIHQVDDTMLSALLSNILLYLLALPMGSVQVQLFFRLTVEDDSLKITIASQGFETNQSLQNAVRESESLYTDMIHFPQLVNFYAAQKMARQLKSAIRVQFLGLDKQRISVRIPFAGVGESTYSK
jgi:light-regulated signal transduction histidine kinase (bacteriophytochrome)